LNEVGVVTKVMKRQLLEGTNWKMGELGTKKGGNRIQYESKDS